MKKSKRTQFDGLDDRYSKSHSWSNKNNSNNGKYHGIWQYLNYDVLPKDIGNLEERLALVADLCRENGDIDNMVEEYLDFISTSKDLPKSTVSAWGRFLKPLEIAADYLTIGFDDCYTQEQLDRKEYSKERKHTTKPFTDVCPVWWEGIQVEYIDKKSIGSAIDTQEIVVDDLGFVNNFDKLSETEKQIVVLLCNQYKKVEIQSMMGLSEAQLETVLKHIRKKLRPETIEPVTSKRCRKCNVHKDIGEFSPDRRNVDKLHCYCKKCVTLARKMLRKTPLQHVVNM